MGKRLATMMSRPFGSALLSSNDGMSGTKASVIVLLVLLVQDDEKVNVGEWVCALAIGSIPLFFARRSPVDSDLARDRLVRRLPRSSLEPSMSWFGESMRMVVYGSGGC